MKWFAGVKNLSELKARYKDLAKKHHPDIGGNSQNMAEINAEYDDLLKSLPTEERGKQTKGTGNVDDGYRDIINAIIDLPNIIVELCGSWLWISGATYAVKDQLKSAGCKWAPKKKMWYWRPEEYARPRWNKSTMDMESIRMKYGSTIIEGREHLKLAAV